MREFEKEPWKEADRIVRHIKSREPQFGNYTVRITDYGAKACNRRLSMEEEYKLAKANAQAIYKAVCYVSGQKQGGSVIVPEGIFYTGPIHLESDVNLHLEEGAVLRFGRDTKLYAGECLEELYDVRHVRTRFEGVELMNYSPFLYAFGKKTLP